MADRTSAEIFGLVFEHLAEEPSEKNIALARKLWPYMHKYDFSPYQMYCDESLEVLGLARRGRDYHGFVWLYGPDGDE